MQPPTRQTAGISLARARRTATREAREARPQLISCAATDSFGQSPGVLCNRGSTVREAEFRIHHDLKAASIRHPAILDPRQRDLSAPCNLPNCTQHTMQGLVRPTTTAMLSTRQLVHRPAAASAVARIVAQRMYATPNGPPPAGFRQKRPTRWDEEKETVLDRAGRFFLMTEMFRGMYVAMEQYFRAPYV